MNLTLIQEEVKQWTRANFGSQPLCRIILGLAEEIGEIAEAIQHKTPGNYELVCIRQFGQLMRTVLKGSQQIREHADAKAYEERLKAQINEMIKCLVGWREGMPIEQKIEDKGSAAIEDGVADLAIYLLNFSVEAGLDLQSSISKVWSEVKKRDWKAYPKNGLTE